MLIAAAAILATAQEQKPTPAPSASEQRAEANVNERYTVESVEISGFDQARFSKQIRNDLHSLVGQKFSQTRLDQLLASLRKALPGRDISARVSRGSRTDHVKIVVEVHGHRQRFDLASNKALYNSREGWSGELDATINAGSSYITFGVLSDGDALLERYGGIRARYENRHVGTDRVRLSFEFDSYHNVWNAATRAGIDGTHELYRTRQNFEPAVTVTIARPLKASFGLSFERLQSQYPAAHTEASNAVITTLRYDRVLEASGGTQQRLEAGYSLRAATSSLQSDYEYNRHAFEFRYTMSHGNHRLGTHLTAGVLDGAAPMFDRFVLGNSTTLRGWSKYDVAPLGGNRELHNSVDYRYRSLGLFYDAGAVWTAGTPATARHSVGAGVHIGDLALLIAFPVKNGRAEPVFIAGLNL